MAFGVILWTAKKTCCLFVLAAMICAGHCWRISKWMKTLLSGQTLNMSDRPLWDYGSLQFRFDKTEYEQALENYRWQVASAKEFSASIFFDSELGYVLQLSHGFGYVEPHEPISLFVDSTAYRCQIVDVEREFCFVGHREPEDDEWPIRYDTDQRRLICLPNDPALLSEWLNRFLDVDLFSQCHLEYFCGGDFEVQPNQIYTFLRIPAVVETVEVGRAYRLQAKPERYAELQAQSERLASRRSSGGG